MKAPLPPLPTPPICTHPERPEGKPLCPACWAEYKPKFESWRQECERRTGMGHA